MPKRAASSTNEAELRTFYDIGGLDGQGVFILDNAGNQVIYFGDKTPLNVELAPDSGNSKYTYVGTASAGSATSEAVWRIIRLDETVTNSLSKTHADGDSQFNNIWDDRESLSYS